MHGGLRAAHFGGPASSNSRSVFLFDCFFRDFFTAPVFFFRKKATEIGCAGPDVPKPTPPPPLCCCCLVALGMVVPSFFLSEDFLETKSDDLFATVFPLQPCSRLSSDPLSLQSHRSPEQAVPLPMQLTVRFGLEVSINRA